MCSQNLDIHILLDFVKQGESDSCHHSQLLGTAHVHCWQIRTHSSTPHPLQSKDRQLTAGLASSTAPQGHFFSSAASLMGGDSQQMGRLVTTAVISALSNCPCRNATVQIYVNRLFPPDLCKIQKYITDA